MFQVEPDAVVVEMGDVLNKRRNEMPKPANAYDIVVGYFGDRLAVSHDVSLCCVELNSRQ